MKRILAIFAFVLAVCLGHGSVPRNTDGEDVGRMQEVYVSDTAFHFDLCETGAGFAFSGNGRVSSNSRTVSSGSGQGVLQSRCVLSLYGNYRAVYRSGSIVSIIFSKIIVWHKLRQ